MTSNALGIDYGASVAIASDTFSVNVPTITEALILAAASRVAKLDISLKSAVRETPWGRLCLAAGVPGFQ